MKKTNEQDDFLINILTTADSILKQEKVFTLIYDDHYEYNKTHLEEVAGKIATELGGFYRGPQIKIANDTQNYTIDLTNLQTDWLLTDLKKSIAKTWKTSVSRPSLKKDYIIQPGSYYTIACYFNSADEILKDREYINAQENLEQAELHLVKFKTEQPENVRAIKNLTDIVTMHREIATSWQGIYERAKIINYKALNEIKRQEAIDKIAKENKEIRALIEENRVLQYTPSRYAYDLFKAFGLEPKNNIALYKGLQIVELICTSKYSDTVTYDENDKEISRIKGDKRFPDVAAYIELLQKDIDVLDIQIKDCYTSKGVLKKLSHRKLSALHALKNRFETLNTDLDFVIKNEKTLLKFIPLYKPEL